MALCPSCWGIALAAVKARGLGPLIAEDRAQARRLAASEEHVGQTTANFEPMNYAMRLIAGQAMLTAGPGILQAQRHGCLTCLLGDPTWFAAAADYAADEATRLGVKFEPPKPEAPAVP